MKVRNSLVLLVTGVVMLLIITLPHSNSAQGDIKAFVRVQYHHGVPYDRAVQFDQSVVPTLLAMLKDPNEKKWWGNIIYTLGVIGDERAVDPLINFLDRDIQGEVNSSLLSALLSVPTALGHIAGKGSDQALNYLIASAKPQTRRTKTMPWRFGQLSDEKLYPALMKASIIGLGISAQPRAMQVLEQMHTGTDTPQDIRPAVAEAVKLSGEIKSKGRMEVFGKHH